MSFQHRLARRVQQALIALLVLGLFVPAVGYLLVRHVLWPYAPRLLPHAVAAASEALERPVTIGSASTRWDGLHPALTLRDVALGAPASTPQQAHRTQAAHASGEALVLPQIDAVLSWRSLLVGEPRFAQLRIVGAHIAITRETDGAWRVAGFRWTPDAQGDRRGLRWLLAQRRIDLTDARIALSDSAGRPALTVEDASGAIQNIGRSHRVAVRVGRVTDVDRTSPAHAEIVGMGLDLRGDFVHKPHVPAVEVERWQGSAYIAADRLDLGSVVPRLRGFGLLPAQARWASALPTAGQAAARAWIDASDGHVSDATLKLDATAIRWKPSHEVLVLPRLHLDARLMRDDDGYALRVHDADAVEAGGARLTIRDHAFDARFDASGQIRQVATRIDELDLATTLALLRRLPVSDGLRARLAGRELTGRLHALQLGWSRPRNASMPDQYELAAQFDRLGLAPRPAAADGAADALGTPGFAGLNGRVTATQAGGELHLHTGESSLSFPGLFAEPTVALKRLAGAFAWTVDHRGSRPVVAVRTARLDFANKDATGWLSGSWRNTGATRAGTVDLTGSLTQADATRTARYLPLHLPQPVRDWVARSVLAGRSDQVDFRLRGDLRDFPYRDGRSGEFRIAARLHDGMLRYAPEWPPIEAIGGELVFERASMRIAAGSARSHGVQLADVRATIADFAASMLQVEGTGTGSAQRMLDFVGDSPVGSMIGGFTADATADGNAALSLKLALPLEELSATRVQGAVQFAGNTIALDRTMPRFDDVTGRLEFSDAGFSLREMRAAFLGGPLRISGETVSAQHAQVRGEGSVSADALRTMVDNPITRKLSGSMRYAATIDVRQRMASVSIESDLIGLAADLPPPFGKAAAAPLPLQVQSAPFASAGRAARPAGDIVSAQLGNSIQAAFERRRGADDKLRVQRGAFAIDADAVLPDAGFAVTVKSPQVDLDAWQALLRSSDLQAASQPGDALATDFSLVPSTLSVVTDQLRVAGKQLHQVVLGASRADGFWRANVSSREIDGFFNWREAGPGQPIGTLTARFTRLVIPPSRAQEVESLLDSAPQQLPGLDIAADELVLGDKSLGALALRATNGGTAANPVWQLEQLTLVTPDARLDATGRWARRSGARERSTDLKFELTLNDAGALLGRFGVHDAIRGGAGVLSGDIGWKGSPLAIDYPSSTGQMHLAVGQGQFLKVDPGLAKLIGVLNLQSLPRRLTLDFRDMFSEGFAFDEIDGDVRIAQGIAHTDNLRMRGVQAVVRIQGKADLARETQDLKVRVVPELNAGLASLAYAALANPVIGLGTFVAQMVMRRPLQQAFAYDVAVKGPWADPVVTPQARVEPVAPVTPVTP